MAEQDVGNFQNAGVDCNLKWFRSVSASCVTESAGPRLYHFKDSEGSLVHSATFVTHTCITLCLLARSREDHYFPITYIKKVYLNVDTDTYIYSKLSTFKVEYIYVYLCKSHYENKCTSLSIYK